jgi:hypothetical protein
MTQPLCSINFQPASLKRSHHAMGALSPKVFNTQYLTNSGEMYAYSEALKTPDAKLTLHAEGFQRHRLCLGDDSE